MVTVTITATGEVVDRARRRAEIEGTTLERELRRHLEAYAGDDPATTGRRIVEIAKASPGGSSRGGRAWRREDLYDRPILR